MRIIPPDEFSSSRHTVNYLHYGDSLNWGHLLDPLDPDRIHRKHDLIETIIGQKQKYLVEVIRGYGRKRAKRINMERFKTDFRHSLANRTRFEALGCRGFSFRVHESAEFCDPIREEINLRIALMADEELFYPPRIKRYLRRVNNNHWFSDGFPSLAFSLGIRGRDAWYVFVLQSDLAFRSPPYVRDHLRGWRKILFASILRLASKRVPRVYLCRAEDALRACSSCLPVPRVVPESWKSIYERTAADFGLRPIRLGRPVDIQLLPNCGSVYADAFYEATITPELSDAHQFQVGGPS